MKPTRAKEYSVDLRVQVSRRGRMMGVMEISVPAATIKEAQRMAKPSTDALLALINRRRSKADTSGEQK